MTPHHHHRLPSVNCQRYLLDFLAERKSYADLSASIIDGRYGAQKAALGRQQQQGGGGSSSNVVFYILEGDAADLNAQGQGEDRGCRGCCAALCCAVTVTASSLINQLSCPADTHTYTHPHARPHSCEHQGARVHDGAAPPAAA
jgi:hypothetical protein